MNKEIKTGKEKLKKQTILIVEKDSSAAKQMCDVIEESFKIKTICTDSTDKAKDILKNDISIKYLITSYDITEKQQDRLNMLVEYCDKIRSDVRKMGIGTFEKSELMFGDDKVFLQSTKDFITQMTSLISPHVVFLDDYKNKKKKVSFNDFAKYPYDV